MTGHDFVSALAEIVGYKLGLAVTSADLERALSEHGLSEFWPEEMVATYRLRSETYEQIALAVLHHFGDPDAKEASSPPVIGTLRALPEGDQELAIVVLPLVVDQLRVQTNDGTDGPIDGNRIFEFVLATHGADAARIALTFLSRMQGALLTSPWSRVRRADWSDLAALRDLFETEGVSATWGTFFDQRFIDYLDVQTRDLAEINWRRFEGLVAEYLDRAGLRVEVGLGRNDDGVDLRAWLANAEPSDPALLVVQCKREKTKTSKVVLKALAEDVRWEGATAGLLVTTAEWSPGARATASLRAYPVIEASGTNVARWITRMRTPGTGVWLAT